MSLLSISSQWLQSRGWTVYETAYLFPLMSKLVTYRDNTDTLSACDTELWYKASDKSADQDTLITQSTVIHFGLRHWKKKKIWHVALINQKTLSFNSTFLCNVLNWVASELLLALDQPGSSGFIENEANLFSNRRSISIFLTSTKKVNPFCKRSSVKGLLKPWCQRGFHRTFTMFSWQSH